MTESKALETLRLSQVTRLADWRRVKGKWIDWQLGRYGNGE